MWWLLITSVQCICCRYSKELAQRDSFFEQPKHGNKYNFALSNFLFSYFSTKIYVVGAQPNCLNERVLLSTQNTCLN